ncbi:MAG: glycogen synthase GlgA [Syntrophobacteraceae bacterium]|nr:glycogen synthase GlgA [Desulfobacteraceae bacterium]
MSKIQILFCASEVSPYAKTGGLADVAGALPEALRKLGCDVRIFMPLYRSAREKLKALKPLAEDSPIPIGIHDYHVHILRTLTPAGIPLYLLEKDEFFDRSHLYGTPAHGDYEDNAERFIAFSRAVHTLCVRLHWYPSIFHLHDWQTALVAAYHRLNWRYDPNFIHSGTVFTIHNLAYQGVFPADYFSLTQLPPDVFSFRGMEFWGQCNFLKAGLVYSDMLTTVSPRYSQEIQASEFGCGMDGLLRDRHNSLVGILNGIDCEEWNTEADPYLPARYSMDDLEGKRACKEVLLSDLGFPEGSRRKPLLGMISRMAAQKGFDLMGEILDNLMDLPVSLVILGTGDAAIEKSLKEMESSFPDRLRILTAFDEALAHRIEAGADIFLMPSRYEPCGLNQMYSLRYGTVPVVHATGGLEDSVVDAVQNPDTGTGFKFADYEPFAFLGSIQAALDLYRNRDKWREIQRRGMGQDFSWTRSAGQYLNIYKNVLARKPKRPSPIPPA